MNRNSDDMAISSSVFQLLLDQAQEGMLIVNEKDQVIFLNQFAQKHLGREKLAWQFQECVSKDSYDVEVQIERRVPFSGKTAVLLQSGGQPLLVSLTGFPTPVEGDAQWFLLAFQLQQKAAVQAVYPGKSISFRNLFESDMFGLLYGDTHNQIIEANNAFLNMVGYTIEDFRSNKIGWREITPSEYALVDQEAIQELRAHGAFKPYEKQLTRKDGSKVDILVGGILEEGSMDLVIAFIIDITPKKQFERALIEGEKLFRTMAESSTMLIWLVSAQGKILYVNEKMLKTIGSTVEKLQRSGWEQHIHPEDLPEHQKMLLDAFQSHCYFENEVRLRFANGQYRWVYTSGGPVATSEGEFIGLIGTAVDIHERKLAEEALSRYTVRLEQSNQELEHFATIASHDLQEPLRKVLIFSDHLEKVSKSCLNDEALDDLSRMQKATKKMQHLISDLLDLSRITRRGLPFIRVEISELIKEVVIEASYDFPGVKNRVFVDGAMMIEADPNQIRQLIRQLLDNALRFHKQGALSQVWFSVQSEGGFCRVLVRDDGIGIKAEYLPKIFQTFSRFYGEGEYEGTGIGLALVKKIVERHKGSIYVDSTPGKGSIFTIILPVVQCQEGNI